MAKKSSKKLKRKRVKRIILVTLLCLGINAYVLYSVGSILKDVHTMKNEDKELNVKLDNNLRRSLFAYRRFCALRSKKFCVLHES